MNTLWEKFGILAGFVFCLGCFPLMGQQETNSAKTKQIKVTRHTVLAKYEPGLVRPAEERIRLKSERLATIKERREIIDTLDISDRKRKQLLQELYRSPFSYKWEKVIAEIEPEDEEDQQ